MNRQNYIFNRHYTFQNAFLFPRFIYFNERLQQNVHIFLFAPLTREILVYNENHLQ